MGTTTKETKAARAAVKAIVADLNDRSGCGIDGLDDDIQREIRAKWTAIVEKAIDGAVRAECRRLIEASRPIDRTGRGAQ